MRVRAIPEATSRELAAGNCQRSNAAHGTCARLANEVIDAEVGVAKVIGTRVGSEQT